MGFDSSRYTDKMNIFDAFSIFENMGLAINGSARTLRVAFWSSRGLMPLLWLLLVTSCQEDPAPGPGQDDPDDPVFAVETGNSAIPYVVIETHGTGILNEPKIHAEMVIYQQKAEIQRAQIGIEYRGSTSFRISDKKSLASKPGISRATTWMWFSLDFPKKRILFFQARSSTPPIIGALIGP
jgi:hypothetical protein